MTCYLNNELVLKGESDRDSFNKQTAKGHTGRERERESERGNGGSIVVTVNQEGSRAEAAEQRREVNQDEI